VTAGSGKPRPPPLEVDAICGRIRKRLERQEAAALVIVGPVSDPTVRYAYQVYAQAENGDGDETPTQRGNSLLALAFDGDTWHAVCAPNERVRAGGNDHPARTLLDSVAPRLEASHLLVPATIPHDAALYLEQAGCELASSTILERCRFRKSPSEIERVGAAQAAAATGIERVREHLARASIDVGEEGHDILIDEAEEPVTPSSLCRVLERAVYDENVMPVRMSVQGGATREDAITPTTPLVISTTVRESTGYHGFLCRTLIAEPDGGATRRAHVAITHGLESVRVLASGEPPTVAALEGDLAAEIQAFGFRPHEVEVTAGGIGLEGTERPAGTDEIDRGVPLRIDARVETDTGSVGLGGVLLPDPPSARWLTADDRRLHP